MIYSISQHKEIPIKVDKKNYYIDEEFGELIRYNVYDNSRKEKIYIGYVDLQDTRTGAKITYIKNQLPDLYKHFGQVADQIELEHCLNRGIENPYIWSIAALGSHVKHFLRGKRFINEGINVYLEHITKNLQKGERVESGFLGHQKMYMPINMINELKEKIKLFPILKGIK